MLISPGANSGDYFLSNKRFFCIFRHRFYQYLLRRLSRQELEGRGWWGLQFPMHTAEIWVFWGAQQHPTTVGAVERHRGTPKVAAGSSGVSQGDLGF